MRDFVEANKIDAINSENLDSFMCKYYDKNFIEEILYKWEENKILTENIHILRNIIMAHSQGLYNLSVPSIITQFESVLYSSYEIKGRSSGATTNKLLTNLLQDNPDHYIGFDHAIHKYYQEELLSNFELGKIIESRISRHAILHGGDIDYGYEKNSIKLILLFDYISDKLKDISEYQKEQAQKEVEML